MSDSSPNPSSGPALPTPTPFDPGSGSLPDSLEWGGRATPVVLLVDAAADRDWAADAAVALAGGWARAGRRVVLADLHLDDPRIHARLGEPNLDGVVDVFLYGASLARTARPVPGRGFYLISSGTYTEEPEAVLRHPRWPRIAAGFGDAQATLLLFVPADAAGVDALARWAPDAIVLGEPDAALRAQLPAGLRVSAVAAPASAALAGAAAAATPAGEAPPADLPPDDAVPGDVPPAEAPPTEVIPWTDPYQEREDPLLGEYAEGIPRSTLPRGAVKTREPDLRDPPLPEVERELEVEEKPRRSWLRPVLLVLLGAALVYAVGTLLRNLYPERFGALFGGSPAAVEKEADSARPAAPAAAAPAAPAPAPAANAAVALPYSVGTKAFLYLISARGMVADNASRLPGVPLYVSPETVDGRLYYKVLAGLLVDTVQAAGLRTALIDAGVMEENDAQWSLIQFTPLAFDLGEFPDRDAALARADSLLRRQVPSYPVAIPFPDGTERWRLYGGAFRDSLSAEAMRRILEERRIEARLVERVGAPPRSQ